MPVLLLNRIGIFTHFTKHNLLSYKLCQNLHPKLLVATKILDVSKSPSHFFL